MSVLDLNQFKQPASNYKPKVRWWWPGGDVQPAELKRELQLLADHQFGGAEIQPFTAGINPETLANQHSPIYTYDSKEYYQKLVLVLEEAERLDLQIDLTMGSGWHAGGDMVPLEENVDTLLYGEATFYDDASLPVPEPEMPYSYTLFDPDVPSQVHPMFKVLKYHPEAAKLVAVIAAKVVDNQRSSDPSVLTDTVHLDLKTAVNITSYVSQGYIKWKPPTAGEYQIVAIYTMPSGSRVLLTADTRETYMVDPFDANAIKKYYQNWIGQHPELLSFAGRSLRALFNDSYEYFAQRFFSDDLIETFRQNRGYDITPYLPAVFRPGQDQAFFFFTFLKTEPDFSFGEMSKRIIHDFNLTISDLFFKHWYPVSRQWIEEQNLQFRQQGYNPPLDVIKAAGAASIPETEAQTVPVLKRVTSGGHLYGRPLITAEAFVFYPGGTFSISTQKYKQGIDLLMTSGVNEIIYHGMPYRWEEKGYGEFGWSPFTSPYGTDIATTVSEADTAIWPYQKEINTYAARLQYLMQQGKASADILIYLPIFADPASDLFAPVLDTVDACGYVWEWVNDECLLQANWTKAGLRVGSMSFQGVIIPDVDALPLETAKQLLKLAKEGAPILIYGQLPQQQPGFYQYEQNDPLVAEAMRHIIVQDHSAHISQQEELAKEILRLPSGKISYLPNSALRYIRRSLDDQAELAFIRNDSPDEISFTLTLDESYRHQYWFEAWAGKIYPTEEDQGQIKGCLPAWGSIALLCSHQELVAESDLSEGNPVKQPNPVQVLTLNKWSLEVTGDDIAEGRVVIQQEALGDWCYRKELAFVSSPGVYTTQFELNQLHSGKKVILDLGEVYSAAEVKLNGQQVGQAIFSPYQLEIGHALQEGINTLEVTVIPLLRNRYLGKAKAGDAEYTQFLGRGTMAHPDPIPSGLIGPVRILVTN